MHRILATIAAIYIAPLAAAQSPSFDEWEAFLIRGDTQGAIRYAENAAELYPQSGTLAYRAALSRALAGDQTESLDWLEAAGERGYSGIASITSDDEFDALRTDPETRARFGAAVAAVRANADARMGAFREAAAESEPTWIEPPRYREGDAVTVIIALHGTGGNGKNMAQAWRAAAARIGAVVCGPDAVRPAQGGGFSWTYRDESAWYVRDLVRQANESYNADKIVLAGFSQGANIAFAVGNQNPELFDAVIPVCGHYEADVANVQTAGDDTPRWYLLIGARDAWHTTYDAAERDMTAAGIEVRVKKLPRRGHEFPTGS
ncbi:MAG: alpha/beta fold hydrolase, partial [Planctomycetota bacterium]